MATKPLRPAATLGRLPSRRRRLAPASLLRASFIALALLGAVALILLILGVAGIHGVTEHFRIH
jgi:hypothetical protein